MKTNNKRILSIILALVMILSMLPMMASAATISGGTVLYLTPNSNWKVDNARFAAYFFGNGQAWASATAVEGETDLYQVTVPTGSWTNVIFCRMNPSSTANNWNNKWNQTADLTYNGTNNHYTVKEGTWDKGGGTWSVYTPPVVETEPSEPTPSTEATTAPSEPETETDIIVSRSLTIHYRNIHLWENINIHAWIPGGSALTVWPGNVISESADAPNWYTAELTGIQAESIGVLFNSDSMQTADFIIQNIPTENAEYWIDETVKVDGVVQIQTSEPADCWPNGSIDADPTITPVYLKPNGNWNGDNARFAMYCFNSSSAKWFDLADSDDDGVYEGIVPELYSTIIFCRMNPATTDNTWENMWNQTADLSVPTDDNNCYIITEGSWDAGAWSKIPPKIISPIIGDGCVTIQYFDNTAEYVEVRGSMNNWSDGYAMTKNDQGIWSVTIPIVGKYQYKLVIGEQWITDPVNPDFITEESGNINSVFTVASGNVAQVGETVYTSVADAAANANGETVKLLLTNQESITVDADLKLDLNGCTMGTIHVAEGYALTLTDSATSDYAGPCGYVQVDGTVNTLSNYVLLSDENSVYSAHCFEIAITHISLQPGKDALGYKATVTGDSAVMNAITGFGFEMSANDGNAVICQKDGTPTGGTFTLRLKNILACGGGEMNITATAFVNFNTGKYKYSNTETTTMKDTIQTVDANWSDYSAEQQNAVIGLMANHADLIAKWNLSNIKAPE